MLSDQDVAAVLSLWFGGSSDEMLALPRDAWFKRDEVFDGIIRQRFLGLWQRLQAGELPFVASTAKAALAWIIVADQFPRNLHRASPLAFASDAQARAASRQMLAQGLDQALPPQARVFVYLPLEHSENLADQAQSIRLFRALAQQPGCAGYLDYALRHQAVIQRFGRFPHRNAALGRSSSAAEIEYLQQPGAGF